MMADQNYSSPKLPYRPGLDGLRGIAVLGVLFYHLEFSWALGGFLGVETFIVISGYLITSLLLEDFRVNGNLNLKRFWLRRIRRLMPALWTLLVGVLALGFTIAPQTLTRLREDIPAALIYLTNWLYIWREIPYFERHASPPVLQHLWSLAIEEQFYLVWPLLLWASLVLWKTRKGESPSCSWLLFPISLAALSAGWMGTIIRSTGDVARAYYGTDTRSAGFLLGGALAVVWPLVISRPIKPRGRVGVILGGGIGAFGLLWLYIQTHEFVPWLFPGGFLLTDLFTVLLIAAAVQPDSFWERVLGNQLLRWIGTRSYAIYLWHWPLIALFRPGAECRWPPAVCALGHVALTLLFAEWSYQVVENPIRRNGFRHWWKGIRKKAWSLVYFPALLFLAAGFVSWRPWTAASAGLDPTPGIPPTPEQIAVVSTDAAAAAQPTPNQTQGISISPSPSPDPTQTNHPGSTPAADTPVITPTSSPTPRWTCNITLIGDSVMARTQLAWMAQNDQYFQLWVNASANRQTEDISPLLDELRRAGELYHTVVLHTGTNGMYSSSTLNDVIARMASYGVRKIYLLNVRVPKGWEGLVNEYIAEAALNWPDLVVLVDWHAASEGQLEWFLDDGVHLSEAGARAYVDQTLDLIRQQGCFP